ncbi:hypothetical protein Pcinc_013319 [Petrolisthes cinctipes]|uniref:Phospholipid/glycerol acyltransferase domain-containing protein n=1 Tax=Petrolisthes cinctipes TaxID=88211 RepID=A0AAE1FYS8_PETCI|nr:hypothetical protein Pcinc_013319 [Petrolisthes cinctipes]
MSHVLEYVTAGMASIMEDNVSKLFIHEEFTMWNFLSRTNNRGYGNESVLINLCWLLGLLVRYCLLLPLRLIILTFAFPLFYISLSFIGRFPEGRFKRWLYSKLCTFNSKILASSLTLVATHHNMENTPKSGLAVANHTSPFDPLLLTTHSCYDIVGQNHGGLMGLCLQMLSKGSHHIWFERTDPEDRNRVVKLMKDRISNSDLPPILLFPEGVCVNNTSVLQFKKGVFEFATTVHPIAVRYDGRFANAFWGQESISKYCLNLLTSWALVCDIWYLPPMTRRPEESATEFADRVKAKIAMAGGMLDLDWDGYLVNHPFKKEKLMQQQWEFARHLQQDEAQEDNQQLPTIKKKKRKNKSFEYNRVHS